MIVRTRRSSQERGAIALLAAILLPILILIFTLMARTALQRVNRQEVEGTADALALAYADQMILNPAPQFGISGQAVAPAITDPTPFMGAADGKSGNSCNHCLVKKSEAVMTPVPQSDGYHPFGYKIQVRREADNSTLLAQAYERLVTTDRSDFSQEASARAWVPQMIISKFIVLRQPLMLVIDYSGAFKLPMRNDQYGRPAVETIQKTVQSIVDDRQAKTSKLGMADVFNFGLVMFAGQPSDSMVVPALDAETLKQTSIEAALEDQRERADSLSRTVPSTTIDDPKHNGTDLQLAINRAVDVLNVGNFGDPSLYGVRPAMMIITDGLPNLHNGNQSYKDAEAAARDAVKQAWNNVSSQQRQMTQPPGIETYTVMIDRYTSKNNQAETAQDAEKDAFQQAISGSQQGPIGKNAMSADDGDSFLDTLHSMRPITHCVSAPFDQFSSGPESGQEISPLPLSLMPTKNDVIGGFFAYDRSATNRRERMVRRYLTFDELVESELEGDQLSFDYTGASTADDSPEKFGFYYDDKEKRVILNGHLCNAILQLLGSGGKDFQFRMRWSPTFMSCARDQDLGCPAVNN